MIYSYGCDVCGLHWESPLDMDCPCCEVRRLKNLIRQSESDESREAHWAFVRRQYGNDQEAPQ